MTVLHVLLFTFEYTVYVTCKLLKNFDTLFILIEK